MTTQTSTDAEAFYAFLGQALANGERRTPPEALVRKWRAESEFDDACEEIRRGIADMEAGVGLPASEAFAELRPIAPHGPMPASSSAWPRTGPART